MLDGEAPDPTKPPPLPGLWQLTALAVVELAEAQLTLGNAMLARAGADDPRRGRVAIMLDRAAAHVRGESYDPPNEALRRLRLQAPRLLALAEELLDAVTHVNAPAPSEASLAELRNLVISFKGESFNGSGS